MIKDPLSITEREKLFELLQNRRTTTELVDEDAMRESILARVRGQNHIVDDIVRLIRQQKAKVVRNRPIANILFLGPTGTGKTEMAKAVTEFLYDDESAMLRFDGPEFSGPEAKTRLVGTSTGYVGSEQGGHLTRPVLNNPNRVVLFDEIEKAYSGVHDLFLSLMGEGRLTEQGSGRVADFTHSVVILTCNAEYEAIGKIQDEVKDPYEQIDPELLYEALLASFKVAEFGARELERIIDGMLAESMIAARESGATEIAVRVSEAGAVEVRPAA